METGGPSAIEVILWILAINAVLILAALGLIALLRRKTRANVAELGKQIVMLDNRTGAVVSFLQAYEAVKEEPYSTPLDQLQGETMGLRAHLEQFLNDCRAFETEINEHSVNNRFRDIINAPAHWFQRWRRSEAMLKESTEISQQLDTAENQIQRIVELPWDLATQTRQVEKDITELSQIARELQSKGVRGAAMQTVINQVPLLERAMAEVPPAYLNAEHNELLAEANFDSTVRVYEVVNRSRPAVTRYLPQAREWQVHYQKASADYTDLRQAGANLRAAMGQQPAGLATGPIESRLDQVAQYAADLNQRLAQPDADQLKSIAREIARLRKVLQDTEQQLTRAGQQLTELSLALDEQNNALERLTAQYKTLEGSESYPLVLDESGILLTDLRQRLAALGPTYAPREPEQISRHLKELEGIREQYKILAERAPQLVEQHSALIALLESPEIRGAATWMRKAREVEGEAGIYDPHNWPKQDQVAALDADLTDVEQNQARLVPADTTTPVKESGLSQRLKETQALMEQHKALRPRVDSIRTRLEKIKALEEEGKEKLVGSYTALERVLTLAENNELLETIAGDEIKLMMEEIRQQGNELNAQGQGEIEKKIQRINTQTDKVTRTMNNWLIRLNAAVADCGKKVHERLVQVETAATLDDSPVQEARALLNREDFTSAALSGTMEKNKAVARISAAARAALPDREHSLGTLEVTAEIKRKNDLWLNLLGVQTELEEKSAPVLSAYQAVAKAREEAREALVGLSSRVPDGKRVWPPSNQTPLPENQTLKPVDSRWEIMRKQSGRADWAVSEMQRLAKQYQLITERALQACDRAEQDQERIQELEFQVDEIKQRWQRQGQSDPNNPVMRAGVQQLMSQSDSRMAFIKQQYMRGMLSYEQVIQNMQLLYDDLFGARVPIDDKTDIGLNEGPRYSGPSNGKIQP